MVHEADTLHAKAFQRVGCNSDGPDAAHVNPEGLGNWYANILRFDRRKCLLCASERTLYTFLIPGVLKKNLLDISNLFRSHLAFNLQYEGFGASVIERVMEEYKELDFAKTISKSMLGSMNDLKHGYEFEVVRAGGIESLDVLAVNQNMNRTL